MLVFSFCGASSNNVFFFNDTAASEIYTLSLHDALPFFSLSCTDGAGNIGTGSKGFKYDGTAPTVTVSPHGGADSCTRVKHAVRVSSAASNNGPSAAGSCDADKQHTTPQDASASDSLSWQ